MSPVSCSTRSGASELDLRALLVRAWGLFASEPLTHVAAVLAVVLGGAFTLGLAFPALLVGYLRLAARQHRGEPITVSQVLDGMPLFAPAFLAGLALTLGIVVGSLLLVLPGVVAGLLGGYSLWFVALEEKGGLEALRASWLLSKSQLACVLLVMLASTAINLLGALLLLGLFVSFPISLIFMTLSFYDLRQG